jgi:hypothetical protein
VRGSEGALANAEHGIERLADERAKRCRRFLLRIKPTITKKSFRCLPALVAWAAQHGADSIDFSPVRPEPFWTQSHYDRLWLNGGEIGELEQIVVQLLRLRAGGARINLSREGPDERGKGLKKTLGTSTCVVLPVE